MYPPMALLPFEERCDIPAGFFIEGCSVFSFLQGCKGESIDMLPIIVAMISNTTHLCSRDQCGPNFRNTRPKPLQVFSDSFPPGEFKFKE